MPSANSNCVRLSYSSTSDIFVTRFRRAEPLAPATYSSPLPSPSPSPSELQGISSTFSRSSCLPLLIPSAFL